MKAPVAHRRPRRRFDVLSLILAPVGVALVLAAQVVEGAPLGGLVQLSSALVVFGGTLGAVLVSYSPGDLRSAVRAAYDAFRPDRGATDALATTLAALSIRSHRRGMAAVESDIDDIPDPFLRSGLSLAVDGVDPEALEQALTVERNARAEDDEQPARIFEAAAGYAPTMGILGAVLGLMRVMEHLSAPGALGTGIALAFVATVYGVGVANLVLLPIAGRLRERALQDARRRDMVAQALVAMQRRTNPRVLAHQLRAFSSSLPRLDELAVRIPMPEQRAEMSA